MGFAWQIAWHPKTFVDNNSSSLALESESIFFLFSRPRAGLATFNRLMPSLLDAMIM